MKRLVSALLLICFLLPTMFVGGVSAKSILEWSEVYDLVHHSTVYYDASDPHHTVYGDNQYAYECYVSKDVGFREMLVFFEKDGAIIRDQTVNEHLISMYYAQNFDSVVSFYEGLSVCDNIIAAANGIKLNQVVDDIASAAAESLGGLTAMYLTGGAMSLSKIAESVAVQTIENLTSHFVDISTIISEAQLNLLFANASRLKYLRGKLDGSWDLRSFAECERFSSYAEEMERICDATVEFLPFLIGDMSTNPVEILGDFLGDMAKGFVGTFGEAIADVAKVAELQKNKPEAIARAIQLASELSKISDDLSMESLVEMDELLDSSLSEMLLLVRVREAYINASTPLAICQSINQKSLPVEEDKPPELPNEPGITIPDGFYTFENGASGLMINVYDGINADETNVVTWKNDGTVDQKFYVKHTGNGKYIIYAVCSADGTGGYTRCLDVYTGGTNVLPAPGHNIDIYKRDKMWDACQLFYIVPQGNGTYAIEVCAVENLVIGAANNGNVEIERWQGNPSQTWRLRSCEPEVETEGVLSEADFAKRIEELQQLYPDGKYWNHANGKVTSGRYKGTSLVGNYSCKQTQCGVLVVNGKTLAYQCHGYALLLSDLVFGSNRNVDTAKWKRTNYTRGAFSGNLRAGDVVRLYTTDDNGGHTVFIYKVTDDLVYYTDCNANYDCRIRWTSKKLSAFKKDVVYVLHHSDNELTGNVSKKSKLSVQYDANGGTIPEAVVIGHRYKVTHDQGVNFRPEPSVESGVITSLKKGTTFEVAINDTKKDNNYTWGKTTINGQVGWVVISDFVTKTTEIRNTDYYIQGSVINRIDTGKPHVQEMAQGVLADFYNNTTFRLEREGYVFLGWSLQAEGGEVISHDLAFLPESICPDLLHGDLTITVYAQWEAVVCEHVWDEGSVTTAASCEENGIRTYSCTRCSEKRTDIIPATGHSVDRDGSCSLCGKQIVELSTMKIRVENATVSAGNTVTVAVLVEQNEGFTYLKLGLEYDDALELVSVSNGTLIDSLTQGKYYVWSASDNQVADGVLAYLTFRAKENAEDGNYTVGVHCLECSNEDEIDVSVIGTAGCITVKSYQYGDANGDQKIDGKDATRLRKYLANYDENTGTCDVEIAEGADVNGDGVVNGKDLTRLLRYLANFDDATGESTIPLGPSN